jgi:hypothetical protein
VELGGFEVIVRMSSRRAFGRKIRSTGRSGGGIRAGVRMTGLQTLVVLILVLVVFVLLPVVLFSFILVIESGAIPLRRGGDLSGSTKRDLGPLHTSRGEGALSSILGGDRLTPNRAQRFPLGPFDFGRIAAASALQIEVVADRVVE